MRWKALQGQLLDEEPLDAIAGAVVKWLSQYGPEAENCKMRNQTWSLLSGLSISHSHVQDGAGGHCGIPC